MLCIHDSKMHVNRVLPVSDKVALNLQLSGPLYKG